MALSVLPLLVSASEKFIRAPGHENQDALYPGEKTLASLINGSDTLLNTGIVTLVLLPGLALLLYATGYRVAGPLLALFSVGLFLARVFAAPA
jgi:hypothetical protein